MKNYEEDEIEAYQTGGTSPPFHKQRKAIRFRAPRPLSKTEGKVRNSRSEVYQLSYSKLSKFLSTFFPDKDETIYLRVLPVKGRKGKAEILETTRRKLVRDSALQKRLERLNQRQGIYFVVNTGGNSDKGIKHLNAFFAEIDDRPIEEQLALFKNAPLPPSILIETKKSIHTYWLLDEDCSEEDWREVMRRLIAYFGSDATIRNPSRVMRLPYFNHVSYSKSDGWQYKKVELIEFNPDRRYTVEQMREAFPLDSIAAQAKLATEHKVDLTTWDGIKTELVHRIMTDPTFKLDGVVYGHAKGRCHGGEGDTSLSVYIPSGAVICFKGCPYSKILEVFGLPPSPLKNGEVITLPQPSEQVFYGLAGEIVNLLDPHTESDRMAILIQTLVLFGNVIGRTAHFQVEADNHFLNLFAVIVGDSSKGRKGTSLGQVKHLFSSIDNDWLQKHLLPGLSSGEGLTWAVRDPIEKLDPIKEKGRVIGYEKVMSDEGVIDKRLVVVEPEFASTLKVLGRETNTLSPVIRQAWDNGNLRILNKNSPAQATNAHISMIGHITSDELNRYLSPTETGNGFANRFLWIYVKRSKLLPEGGKLHQVNLAPIITRLHKAVDFARNVEEMKRDEEANQLWYQAYADLSEGKPGLIGAVTSRSEAQVMRLACIYALLDCSDIICKPHLEAALALWCYAEDSAKFIFGNSIGDTLADEILRNLRDSEDGLTRTQIRDLFARNRSASQINRALRTLAQAGKAWYVSENSEGKGRPTERWFSSEIRQPQTENVGVETKSKSELNRLYRNVVDEDATINPPHKRVVENPADKDDAYDKNDLMMNKRGEGEKQSVRKRNINW